MLDLCTALFLGTAHHSFLQSFRSHRAHGLKSFSGGGLHNRIRNVPHSLGHLNIWFPVGGPIWISLGGVALLKEVYHWGWAVSSQPPTIPCILCSTLTVKDVSSCFLLQLPCFLPLCCRDLLVHWNHQLS